MIQRIRLQNFRSYIDSSFEFSSGVTIIVGPNASGKTNLLEAILVSCVGASYRVKDVDLIHYGADWLRLDVGTPEETRIIKLQQKQDVLDKRYEIAGRVFRRLSSAHHIPVVLFEPEHMLMLQGGPDRRRDYVDGILSRTKIGYATKLKDYKRAVAQRNRLLKSTTSVPADQYFVWNVKISELGSFIAQQRNELVMAFNERMGEFYERLSGVPAQASVHYAVSVPLITYPSSILKGLESNLSEDRERGFTSLGPHREDIVFSLHDKRTAQVASRGENRTLLLALKLFELEYLNSVYGRKPIILLDDVFSELDGARRQALTKQIADHQAFITTTDADVVVQHFIDDCSIIPLERL